MKQIILALVATCAVATSVSAMQSKDGSTMPIVHSDAGEIRISPNNDSR